MSDTRRKSPGRPRSARSHQAILQAALELLAELGYEATSVEAIASRARVGKATIYRRYSGKEELVADAIESLREEVQIPNTGTLWGDIDALIENAARITLDPLGRQTFAAIVSSASSSPPFARIYWKKYLQPRRQAFAIVIERAQARNELPANLDSGLVFDTMSGIMLYASIFQTTSEPWSVYVRRALGLLFGKVPAEPIENTE